MPKLAQPSSTSLVATSYVLLTLEPVSDKTPLKQQAHAYALNLEFTNLLTAATATVKFTRDAAGDYLTAPPKALTIEAGETTANAAGVASTLNTVLLTDQTAFYVWVKLDAGSATVTANLTWD